MIDVGRSVVQVIFALGRDEGCADYWLEVGSEATIEAALSLPGRGGFWNRRLYFLDP